MVFPAYYSIRASKSADCPGPIGNYSYFSPSKCHVKVQYRSYGVYLKVFSRKYCLRA